MWRVHQTDSTLPHIGLVSSAEALKGEGGPRIVFQQQASEAAMGKEVLREVEWSLRMSLDGVVRGCGFGQVSTATRLGPSASAQRGS